MVKSRRLEKPLRSSSNLSLKLGGEVGELDDLASVLDRERCSRLLVSEGKHARGAAVEVGLEGLVVFTDSRMMLEAGVHVAIADHKAAFRFHCAIAEIVRHLDHLHPLPRLLVL